MCVCAEKGLSVECQMHANLFKSDFASTGKKKKKIRRE